MMNSMYPSYLNAIIERSDVTYLRSYHTMSLPKFKTVTYGNNCVPYKAPITALINFVSRMRHWVAAVLADVYVLNRSLLAELLNRV